MISKQVVVTLSWDIWTVHDKSEYARIPGGDHLNSSRCNLNKMIPTQPNTRMKLDRFQEDENLSVLRPIAYVLCTLEIDKYNMHGWNTTQKPIAVRSWNTFFVFCRLKDGKTIPAEVSSFCLGNHAIAGAVRLLRLADQHTRTRRNRAIMLLSLIGY